MGGLMHLRKLFVGFAAVVLPVGTLIGVSSVAVQPAAAAPSLVYCTGGKGVVNFKQTAAPALANGLTQLGYYETTSAKAQTTVTGVTGGQCHAGTSTAGASLGAGTVAPLPAIKTNPCRARAAGVAPIVECTQTVIGHFNIASGSKPRRCLPPSRRPPGVRSRRNSTCRSPERAYLRVPSTPRPAEQARLVPR